MSHEKSIFKRNNYNLILLWICIFQITFIQSNEIFIERKFLVRNCRDNNCSRALDSCIQDRCNSVSQCQNCIDKYNPECSECSKDIFEHIPDVVDGDEIHLCDIQDDVQVLACRYYCRGNFRTSGDCVPYSNSLDYCDCSANTVTTTPRPTTPTSTIGSTNSQESTTTTLPRGTLIRTFGPHRNPIWSLELLSNGFVAAGDISGDIRIWNPNNGELIRVLANHTSGVYGLKLLSNGNLASAADDKKIIIWDVNNGNIVRFIQNNVTTSSLETLQDDRIVAGGFDGNIRLYNRDLSLISSFQAHRSNVRALKLLPNGNFASASWDYSVKIWNTSNNFAIVSTGTHAWQVYDLDLIHDGNLASGGWDQLVRIWNSVNGNAISSHRLYTTDILAIRYLNNNLLAVTGEERYDHVRIYNTLDWSLTETLNANSTSWITSLELLSNGNLIAGSVDGLLRVWQI